MIGLPPSEEGGFQLTVICVASMSDTLGLAGAPGTSVMMKV